MAAVLACGTGALLSHRSAAALWDLLPSAAAKIDVIGTGKPRRGIRLHQTRTLHPEDRSTHDSIPVTSIARTIIDLAEAFNHDRLKRLIARADELKLFDLTALDQARARANGRRGSKALGRALTDYREPGKTRSPSEREFVDLCRRVGLPLPATNVHVENVEVDAFWAEQTLIVELDGYEFHSSRGAFGNDRKRDALLSLAGYEVLRFSANQVRYEPEYVSSTVSRMLRQRSLLLQRR